MQDVIFSDSAFFFDSSVISKLLNFYKSHKPLKCELSSYGDFLQPLGLAASPSYIVEKITSEDLASTRSALYRTLYGLKLSILVLKNSNFHHLGTMKEYIDSLSCKNKFSEMFPISRFSVSAVSVNNIVPLYIEGTVMHSIIHPLSLVPESAVIECCDINIAVDIGQNCIISNVQLHGVFVQRLSFQIPENTLMHTVSVMGGYVCIACAISDDIKKTFKWKDYIEIKIFGKKLKQFIRPDDSIFSSDCSKPALWNAKLFPLCKTADEAFKKTLEIIVRIKEEEMFNLCFMPDDKVLKWVSMSDVLSLKDTENVLKYQKELYEKIMLKKKSVDQFM
ncbi:Fucose-1-phosphate guanylyltransferase, partial [Stegodyphus mimosarum]